MVKISKEKFKSFKHLHCQFVIKVFKIFLTSFVVKDDEKIEKRMDEMLIIISSIIYNLSYKTMMKSFKIFFHFFDQR